MPNEKPDLLESLDCGAATDTTGVLNPVGAKPLLLLEYFPECKLVDAAKGGSDGCGAKLIKVVLVARLVDGIPELAVKLTLDIGTIVGTLVINSGPSNSGP